MPAQTPLETPSGARLDRVYASMHLLEDTWHAASTTLGAALVGCDPPDQQSPIP